MDINNKVMIVDEESMLTWDSEVAQSIIKRMDDNCRIIVIGDIKPILSDANGLTKLK